MSEKHYIQFLIEQGEHQRLDFKFAVNDSKKIARSLSAFANTIGGTLLIGVKDNGKIVGVSSDEEFYMVQAAADLYTKPEILLTTNQHKINGKTVLEVIVPKSTDKPHKAPDEKGNYKAFIRIKDENKLANSILIKVWKKEKAKSGVKIFYNEEERFLLNYFKKNESITFNDFYKKAKISKFKAERILVNFILVGIIEIVFDETGVLYKIKNTNNNNNI